VHESRLGEFLVESEITASPGLNDFFRSSFSSKLTAFIYSVEIFGNNSVKCFLVAAQIRIKPLVFKPLQFVLKITLCERRGFYLTECKGRDPRHCHDQKFLNSVSTETRSVSLARTKLPGYFVPLISFPTRLTSVTPYLSAIIGSTVVARLAGM